MNTGPMLELFKRTKPVIGMIHLAALPGAPRYAGSLAEVRERALRDAEALARGGVQALTMENFGDAPFYPGRVPASVVANMTAIAGELRRRFDLPLGINVLRNDGISALSIAAAVGAAMIRVNVLCGAQVTDQGVIAGIAHDLLRERALLSAQHVLILADVGVKHATPLGLPRPLPDEVHDVVQRGGADAVIATGSATGAAARLEALAEMKHAAGDTPVLVGSGISASNIGEYARHADGFIVGTSLKVDGVSDGPVDVQRVRALMAAARR